MTTHASAPASLDPFSVIVVFATSYGINGDFASIMAAYGIILLSAGGAAAWSSASLPKMSLFSTFLHILTMMSLAIVATVPIAELVSRITGLEIRFLLAPLSIIIAARPDWVISSVKRIFLKRFGLDEDKK